VVNEMGMIHPAHRVTLAVANPVKVAVGEHKDLAR
jgi:hypothetical protein